MCVLLAWRISSGTTSSDTADLIDHVRKLPPEQFVEFMLEMGLYELLRGEKVEELSH